MKLIRGVARAGLDELPVQITKPRPPKERIEGRTPKEVVDEVWRLATQGQLLNLEGWRVASGFFTEPTPFPANEKILVVSNDWGPAYDWRSNENTPEVALGYTDAGSIDAMLRYSPPPKSDYIKTAFAYSLVTVPAYIMMYGPDGKTLVERKPTGTRVWQIKGSQGPPFTTVNTAIRYVLEMRNKTHDADIRKNADQALAKLEQLH